MKMHHAAQVLTNPANAQMGWPERHYAMCVCGWRGPVVARHETAQRHVDAHLRKNQP